MSSLPDHRDLMAPENEPSDEELHLVMREALELAMARKQGSDAWLQQRLWEEVARIKALQGPSQQ
jgi:hypothetical protein